MAFRGAVQGRSNTYKTLVVLDAERRMSEAECGCNFYQQNRLYQGPCEHMLALRIAEHRGISDVIDLRKAKEAKRALSNYMKRRANDIEVLERLLRAHEVAGETDQAEKVRRRLESIRRLSGER